MKVFDAKGEYSPEEVKAALAGIDGTRQLSFRYERLDKDNTFIEEVDYIQSCSIENNSLADIKRTAKLDILDTGRMNYLQDRIKPYIRIAMPKDDTYSDAVKALDPAVWWKLDDKKKTEPPAYSMTVPLDNSYSSQATALALDTSKTNTITFQTSVSDATVRDEFWQSYNVTDSEPLMFNVVTGNPVSTSIYTADSLTGDLTLVESKISTINGTGPNYFRYPFPRRGYYFVKVTGQVQLNVNVPRITTSRPSRLEDSSNNHVNAIGTNLNLQAPALVADGGKAVALQAFQANWGVDKTAIKLDGGFSVNYWAKPAMTSTGNCYITTTVTTGSMTINVEYMDQGPSQSDSAGWVGLWVSKGGGVYSYNRAPIAFSKYRSASHMFTYVVEDDQTSSFYIDGTLVLTGNANADLATDLPELMVSDSITSIDNKFSGDGASAMDDFSLYSTSLTKSEISNLVKMGTTTTGVTRSGYVEWPQGVFVLSSPTRKMVDGNTVVREVEGYDQLVTLKEDSFDYRYSVPAGTKYTDAVAKVLNYRTPANYPIVGDTSDTGTSAWSVSPEVTVTSGSSMSFPTSSPFGVTEASVRTPMDVDSAAIAAKLTIPSSGQIEMALSFTYDRNDYGKYSLLTDTTTLDVTYSPYSASPLTTLKSIPYDPIKHAYWRVRESNGTVYFEVSDTGSMWTSITSTPHTYTSNATSAISFFSYSGGTGNILVENILASYTTNANKNITDSVKTLPTAMEWEPGTSKLSIINDLLGAVNYTSATYNEDGIFTARPYVSPADRTPEFTYATDESSVIVGDVSQTVDLFAVPNKWVVVVSDPDRPALVGSYVNDSPNSPTSTVSRGRTIVDYRTEQAAPDQLTLDALASRLAFEASQIYEAVTFETALMPIHQTADVYYVDIEGLVIDNKYSEQSWSMELKVGATMSHKIRRIVAV